MKKNIFQPAIEWMKTKQSDTFHPISFQDYLKTNNLPMVQTASYISVDSLEKLNPLLRAENVMVFRLGSSNNGTGTQFALHRANDLREYFLIDDEVFTDKEGTTLSLENKPEFLAYSVLPNLSETSLVNLGLTSGLIGQALKLDDSQINIVPATCQAAFSFFLKLHHKDLQIHLHNKGQIEIDVIFFGKRAGEPILFIIEAKNNPTHRSIAKHKMVYPIMAIAKRVPISVKIIPIYLKILDSNGFWHFHIVECEFPDPRTSIRAIDELKPISHSYIKVPHISFNHIFD